MGIRRAENWVDATPEKAQDSAKQGEKGTVLNTEWVYIHHLLSSM